MALDKDDGDRIQSLGCKYMQGDVTSPASIASFKETFFGHDEPVDLLLNIAGRLAAVTQCCVGQSLRVLKV